MMPEEERWEVYCDIAVGIVNNEEMTLEEFIEALRILRLCFYIDALKHLRQLFTLYTLCLRYIRSGNYTVIVMFQRYYVF